MARSMTVGVVTVLVWAGGAWTVGGWGGPAAALGQIRIEATQSVMGGPGARTGQIGQRSLERYAEVLSLSDEQRELARGLHEGYQASYEHAAGELRETMDEARRALEETQDNSLFREKMPEAQRAFQERTGAIEKEFLGDLRQILTPEQEARWPKIERLRRRETTLKSGSLSGETVDLVEVVSGLALSVEGVDGLEGALDEYEVDLDRALQAKEKMLAEQTALPPGRMDLEEMRARMAVSREAGLAIKGTNERHTRKIEPLLPEGDRAGFRSAVKRQSFPRVYRPSRVTRMLEAAAAFSDLDKNQRESLAALRESYERELAGANQAWAAAIEEDEKSGNSGLVGQSGGMVIRMMEGDEESGPLADARKARRELDERVRERVLALLSEEQRGRLPKERDEGEGGFRPVVEGVRVGGPG